MGDPGHYPNCYDTNCDGCLPLPDPPCPQCARFWEKMDREKMETIVRDILSNPHTKGDIGDALIKYLTE